jgi:O-antigen/teichoic acid export membrane protein
VTASEPTDVLRTGEAGGLVIRGGVLRGAGYAAGILLGAGTSVLLLRHLGVEDFGRYGVVVALIGIVSAVTDAGLTAVGSRELAILPVAERPALLRNLVALRIGLTAAGVAAATGFAAIAGYPGVVVAGTALAGLGVLLLNTQSTLMMPLAIELRLGAITLVEALRHALTLVGVAVLVLVGASLLPFLSVQIAVGAIVLLLTPALLGGFAGLRPQLHRTTARMLLRESLPIAAAIAMNVVYLRLLMILVSVQTDERETGLFATAFRIFEILLGIPTLVLAVALPLLAVAGAEDRERLRYALQRMTEIAVAASLLLVLVTVVLAEQAIVLLGGEAYRDAAPILRLLAFALLGIFVSQVLTLGLVSLRRQRDVALANGLVLALVIVLGLVLVEAYEGMGAAAAAVATEAVLALLLIGLLARFDRAVLPTAGLIPRVLAAGVIGGLVALLPVTAWLAAPLAALAFVIAAFALRAVPPEVVPALRGKKQT